MTDAVNELMERVIVDAYGDDEQLTAFEQWFADAATFPFAARVVGVDIEVLAIEYHSDVRHGLRAVCSPAGERQTLSLLDIVPDASIDADTLQLIHAYRRWANAPSLPTTAN
jgi:hypothetical protein